jgi:hypothetical protein
VAVAVDLDIILDNRTEPVAMAVQALLLLDIKKGKLHENY